MTELFIGTAGWSLPSQMKNEFPSPGTHLERYARVLNGVEINSCFYREHKPETYTKWAAAVPDDFRFAVKLSRYFTQEMRLRETGEKLREILAGIAHLGKKWDVLLVQLPPSLDFEPAVAAAFLAELRGLLPELGIAWEPRHRSWTTPPALALLAEFKIAKVLADPEPCPLPVDTRTHAPLNYIRWHGSPEIYKSRYAPAEIERLAESITGHPGGRTWCIFDNTTYGFATENARELQSAIARPRTGTFPAQPSL